MQRSRMSGCYVSVDGESMRRNEVHWRRSDGFGGCAPQVYVDVGHPQVDVDSLVSQASYLHNLTDLASVNYPSSHLGSQLDSTPRKNVQVQ